MNPPVTVLMALYNGGAYLTRSIKSVLDQTHKEFEFLIINDCSTDDSVKVIESFRDPRIRIHHNPQNIGQTRSLNVGLKLAQGEWIARMDADDIALAPWLEEALAFIRTHPDFAVVSVDAFTIDKQGKVKSKYLTPTQRDDIILKAFFKSPVNHVGSLISRRVALELGGYDEKYRTVADFDLWKKMIMSDQKLIGIGQTCMAIRRTEESLSFKDLGANYFMQLAEITGPIINRYSKVSAEQQKLSLLLRALYTPQGMSAVEFDESLRMLKSVTEHVIVGKFEDPRKIASWSAKFRRELILKRIRVLIDQKDYTNLRRASLKGIKESGVFSSFTYFYLASVFGGALLSFVPSLYNALMRWRVLLRENVRF